MAEVDFSIGRVLARGTGAVAADPARTLGRALLFGAAPACLYNYFAERASADETLAVAAAVASLVVGAVTNLAAQGALTPVVLEGRDGAGRTGVGGAVRALPALVAAGLLVGVLCLVAGAFALLPGLALFALWSVAGPAIAAEGLGPVSGLRRSAALVRPVFWRVLLLNTLLLVGYLVFWLAIGAGGLYLWYGSDAFVGDEPTPLPLGFWLASAPLWTAATALWGSVAAALYAALRERLDGVPSDHLRRVFD